MHNEFRDMYSSNYNINKIKEDKMGKAYSSLGGE
jgi:hypothetical protein